MESVSYCNSLNFKRIEEMGVKDQVPPKSKSYLLKKADVKIKHISQGENEVY